MYYQLQICPYCKTDKHLKVGHIEFGCFSVRCMQCMCHGPVFSYGFICDDEDYILPEFTFLKLLDTYDPTGDYVDEFLTDLAIQAWNLMRATENGR